MLKKGVEFTLTTLISVVLVLIIAAVLFFVLLKQTTIFVESNKCTAQGGFCTTNCDYAIVYVAGCEGSEVCCLKPS